MTNDGWPYRPEHWEGQDEFVVTGPGWDRIGGTFKRHEAITMSRAANVAYAEGKKCELERVLGIVRQFFSCEGIAQEIEKKISAPVWPDGQMDNIYGKKV